MNAADRLLGKAHDYGENGGELNRLHSDLHVAST